MRRRPHRRESGQAMVEFALVLPILLALLCGVIDFGWVYYNKLTLTNTAREGARYAVIHYETGEAWKNEAETRMLAELVGVDSATAVVSDPSQQRITATVTAEAKLLTGFTSTLIGKNSLHLTASCTMRLET